ncbi:MAG: hypothetical protein EBU81_10395 [Proteobacteria bacterium]|nr:hypothetical protein [Pseudomonadota bacterium]
MKLEETEGWGNESSTRFKASSSSRRRASEGRSDNSRRHREASSGVKSRRATSSSQSWFSGESMDGCIQVKTARFGKLRWEIPPGP